MGAEMNAWTPYEYRNLGTDLSNWLQARFIAPIINIDGGWEYWVQIDFPCWLDSTTGKQFDFRREVAGLYPADPSARADWLINATSDERQAASPVTAVEIKAQTKSYVTSKLLRDVAADVTKLQTLQGRNVNGAAIETRIMLVAICDQSAQQPLVDKGFVRLTHGNDFSFYAGYNL